MVLQLSLRDLKNVCSLKCCLSLSHTQRMTESQAMRYISVGPLYNQPPRVTNAYLARLGEETDTIGGVTLGPEYTQKIMEGDATIVQVN